MLAVPALARARSIADKLHHFIDTNGFPTAGDFPETIAPIVERLALRGIDFPVTATAPGFTYEFNFELGVPERSSESLGPVFAERADTVGKNRVDLGFSYLYADLTEFEGKDFADQIATSATIPVLGVKLRQGFRAEDFSLVSHVFSLSATYGVTDRLDLNVLFPLIWTSLDLSGRSTASVIGGASLSEEARFDASAFGPGDLLFRAKYRFLDAPVKIASIAVLRLPTGSEGDFHGIGDATLLGGLVLSRAIRSHDLHGSLGFELNADDPARSRARYALGVTVQHWERLALLADLIGSSSFVNDEFTLPAPRRASFQALFGNNQLVESVSSTEVTVFVPRSDVVDLALGVKLNLVGTLVGFASAIVPVTSDGLRADVIPAAGFEWSF
jgi:Putative MetA-pathway of phenol degradation